MTGTRAVRFGIVVGVVLVSAALVATVWTWLARIDQRPAMACDQTLPLRPGTTRGRLWQQHRNWLAPESEAIGQHMSYLVWNRRTDERFYWLPDGAGLGRIPVPTRYAEFWNRQWRDDPWAYCLVVSPEPTFELRKAGIGSSARGTPANLGAGDRAEITVSLVSDRDRRAVIDIELIGPDGARVQQWAVPDQSLAANQRATIAVVWPLPADASPGIYTIKVGVFGPNWNGLLHWNDGTAILRVQPIGTARR